MERGLNYTMFSMNRPMDAPCLERYDFDTDITYVMAMLEDRSHTWQINDSMVKWVTFDELVRLINEQEFDRIQGKYLKARDVAALKEYSKLIME